MTSFKKCVKCNIDVNVGESIYYRGYIYHLDCLNLLRPNWDKTVSTMVGDMDLG